MTPPVGYYVHHQGDGHRQRALAIARHAQGRLTLLGTGLKGRCGGVACVELADDRGGSAAAAGPDAPTALHYAPAGHAGLRQRIAELAGWIAQARPALMAVDVSVEAAMLARLAATPVVYVRLSGRRVDPPHLEAFRAAKALMAPFHRLLDDEDIPTFVREKTFYAPGLTDPIAPREVEADLVLGVVGRGGEADDGERWATAARAMPRLRWRVIGPVSAPAIVPPNLELVGWVRDAAARIAGAGVVVGAAGDGLVGAVIAAGRPFVCIPEPRPFDEQRSKAKRLQALGAAVVVFDWPEPSAWGAILARAKALDLNRLTALGDAHGAERAARWLLDLADREQS